MQYRLRNVSTLLFVVAHIVIRRTCRSLISYFRSSVAYCTFRFSLVVMTCSATQVLLLHFSSPFSRMATFVVSYCQHQQWFVGSLLSTNYRSTSSCPQNDSKFVKRSLRIRKSRRTAPSAKYNSISPEDAAHLPQKYHFRELLIQKTIFHEFGVVLRESEMECCCAVWLNLGVISDSEEMHRADYDSTSALQKCCHPWKGNGLQAAAACYRVS